MSLPYALAFVGKGNFSCWTLKNFPLSDVLWRYDMSDVTSTSDVLLAIILFLLKQILDYIIFIAF